MKKFGLFILMVVFAAFIAEAQPGGQGGQGRNLSPEDMATRQTEQMKEAIKMDKAVETRVHALNLQYAKKSQELRAGGNFQDMTDAQREKMRAQMTAQQEEKDKEMKKILSADQFKLYEKYRADASQRMQRRP